MMLFGGLGKKKLSGGAINKADAEQAQLEDTEKKNQADDSGGNTTGRTPEEIAEIDVIIKNYQKYKKKKRIAFCSILLTFAICVFWLYKSFMQPPEPAYPRPAVSTGGNENVVYTAPPSGNPEPTDTPAENLSGKRKDGVYTFLMVGFDQGNGNTDTLMIGSFDSKNHKLRIVSIPRDTCANVYYGYTAVKKINAVYTLGGGIDSLMNAMSDMTGFNIDSYIVVNIKAFTVLVDTLGGVDFDIPHNMNYDDPTQNLHIHFKSGYQHLTGSDAVKVVRWRQNSDGTNYGDIERIKIQQSFLMTVAKQCLSFTNLLTKLDDYVNIFKKYVNTDMTVNNLAWYGREFMKLSPGDIQFYTLPSNYNDAIKGFAYGTIYVDDWVKMVNEYLNPYVRDITESSMNVITRDKNGKLYATSGAIAGGYDSFLDYKEYIAGLKKTSNSDVGSDSGEQEQVVAQPLTNQSGSSNGDIATDSGINVANSSGNAENSTDADEAGIKNETPADSTATATDTGTVQNTVSTAQETDSGGSASGSDLGLFYTGGGTSGND